ncbi:type VI secretion system-associated lipoprotein [Burkholderia sp. SG-MS1]|uniref:type VI secretion system lipoprotein TssJ n=1 Tax=Paraburkholderia sp. SG-MS1 TaxID=2023741 RepID=UPI0014473FF0|nr:type VI secretion system lipoprotein TssJ [Paraburkholderia sp. SG-MS1]NKJ48380.1 type VI secretion system-associated lipoprotein [Paraburkholderia sp. SG-MS1]
MMRQLRTGVSVCALVTITACGVGQAVTDSTVNAAKWAFMTQVKTMNVDLVSRASLNANGAGQSLSTVVRIYQLKAPQTFQQLDYRQLQTNDLDTLKADLLATKDIVLRPDASASISEPMNGDAEYVGVVAFFRDAGKDATWKLVIPKKQWKRTDPVKIEASDNTLTLVGATGDTIRRNAPVQSVPNPRQRKPAAVKEYGTQAG